MKTFKIQETMEESADDWLELSYSVNVPDRLFVRECCAHHNPTAHRMQMQACQWIKRSSHEK